MNNVVTMENDCRLRLNVVPGAEKLYLDTLNIQKMCKRVKGTPPIVTILAVGGIK